MSQPTTRKLTVGILGGMGPMATVDFFRKVLEATPAQRDQDHLNIQIDCNPQDVDEDLPGRAARLEQIGAQIIAIPCNTAHIYYDDIQQAVRIPVLHMIREAAAWAAQQPGVKRLGVLAYPRTLASGMYEKALREQGLLPVSPTVPEREPLGKLIAAVKAGSVPPEAKAAAVRVGEALISRGAEAIVLGCTELPLTLSQADFKVTVVDATQVLAQVTVRRAMAGA